MGGIIPPIRPNLPGHATDRSPYNTILAELIGVFATSQDRANILNGFLDYRAALHQQGLVSGFQWLDGSFLENIEDLENRPPDDIDVVTFFEIPPGETEATLQPAIEDLFDSDYTKANYRVDAYPSVLGTLVNEGRVRHISYWYSMWSHRRDGTWKGFVQIDLNPVDDAQCRVQLAQRIADGFEQ